MNKRDEEMQAYRNKQLFKLGSARGVIKINTGNSFKHELTKFLVCWELAKEGHDFLTEAEGKEFRADIADLTEGVVYEVLCSEQPENLVEKAKVYPLPIYPVEASKWSEKLNKYIG